MTAKRLASTTEGPGQRVPVGGAAGAFLAKTSAVDGAIQWVEAPRTRGPYTVPAAGRDNDFNNYVFLMTIPAQPYAWNPMCSGELEMHTDAYTRGSLLVRVGGINGPVIARGTTHDGNPGYWQPSVIHPWYDSGYAPSNAPGLVAANTEATIFAHLARDYGGGVVACTSYYGSLSVYVAQA